VSRERAEDRRGFDPDVPPKDCAKGCSLFFDDLLNAKVRKINPCYSESEGALLGQFRHLHTDIYGNRECVEHFRDPDRRKAFFKEYKEIEMLYEIISPDAFLRPFMEDYTTLSAIFAVVRKAYAKQVYIDREFQAKKGFDGLTYIVYRTLLDADIENADEVSRKVKAAFVEFPNWSKSERSLRELRRKVTFAIYAQTDDADKVTHLVEDLFNLLERAERI
jgi:hypothetical protein